MMLYRPSGQAELRLVEASGWRAWPPAPLCGSRALESGAPAGNQHVAGARVVDIEVEGDREASLPMWI